MESSKNGRESNEEISEKDENILSFLDSMDTYLTLMDSLSSTLRQVKFLFSVLLISITEKLNFY